MTRDDLAAALAAAFGSAVPWRSMSGDLQRRWLDVADTALTRVGVVLATRRLPSP